MTIRGKFMIIRASKNGKISSLRSERIVGSKIGKISSLRSERIVGNLAPKRERVLEIAKCQFAYPRQSFVNGSSTLPNFSLIGQVSKGKEAFGRE